MKKLITSAILLGWSITGALAQSSSLNLPAQVQTTQTITDTNVLVVGAHSLLGFHATTTNASGGYVVIIDSASVVADGNIVPAGCFAVGAPSSPAPGSTLGMANTPSPTQTVSGLFIAFSTGADCYHLVKAASYISVLYQ